jgi:hypothetical protein
MCSCTDGRWGIAQLQVEALIKNVETMLTAIESCRQQSRNVMTYVTAAVRARFVDQPTPSLLPEA